MDDLAALETCAALTREHAERAASSTATLRALLTRAAEIAAPGTGCPKVLMAVAALPAQKWMEGEPCAELTGDESSTTLAVYADFGFGVRERLVPLVRFAVPLDEFVRAVGVAPQLVAPLIAVERGGRLVVGSKDATEAAFERTSAIAIAESSLHEQERKTSPPPVTPQDGTAAASAAEPASAAARDRSGVHTHPTVRRMVAIRPEAMRSGNDDD